MLHKFGFYYIAFQLRIQIPCMVPYLTRWREGTPLEERISTEVKLNDVMKRDLTNAANAVFVPAAVHFRTRV